MDHDGESIVEFSIAVNFLILLPLDLAIQILSDPLSSLMKTIHFPSFEKRG